MYYLYLLIFLATIVILKTLGYFGKRSNGKKLPQPPSHWLLGHIPLAAKYISAGFHFDQVVYDCRKTCGPLFQMNFIFVKIAIINDPEAVKEVLVTKNYRKSPTMKFFLPVLGEQSLLASTFEVWRKQRDAFNPGFAYQFLKGTFPLFVDKSFALLQKLDKIADTGEIVQIHKIAIHLTLDIIFQTVLSHDLAFLKSDVPPAFYTLYMKLFTKTIYYAESPHRLWERYLPWNYISLNQAKKRVDDIVLDILKKRAALLEDAATDGKEKPKDILQVAIETALSENRNLAKEDVLSQVKTFIFAGHDTTASMLGFCIYEIAQHPHVEEALLAEFSSLPKDLHTLTSEDLSGLKYLNCVVKEALRMWPPGGSARYGTKGAVLQGYDIQDKVLYVAHYPLHRDPELWGPDAHEFKPERWLDTEYMDKVHPYAYIPFSKGPRDCIGQTFALLEAKAVLIILLTHFHFEYAHDKPEQQAYSVTSSPKYHVPVTVHRRKS